MAAMAARAICKETVSFGLVNIVPIQISIARQKANHLGIREVRRERVEVDTYVFSHRIKIRNQNTT
jgi:hypothetical protein